MLLPNTKPVVVGTIYPPPSQTNVFEIFNKDLSKVDSNNVKRYIIGAFNIHLWQNDHYAFEKHNMFSKKRNLFSCQSFPNNVKNYFEFWTIFGLKQLTENPSRITCSSSSIIDHILVSFPDRLAQWGILNVGLFDHQLIYCTRKVMRIKRDCHRQIKFNSFIKYTVDSYEKSPIEINLSEYGNFDNLNVFYSNFIKKLMEFIDKVAPMKNKRIQNNSQEWFAREISERTNNLG